MKIQLVAGEHAADCFQGNTNPPPVVPLPPLKVTLDTTRAALWDYAGCAVDNFNGARTLEVGPIQRPAGKPGNFKWTVEACLDACRGDVTAARPIGWKYAGLEAGNECFCGNNDPSTLLEGQGTTDTTRTCKAPCEGNTATAPPAAGDTTSIYVTINPPLIFFELLLTRHRKPVVALVD